MKRKMIIYVIGFSIVSAAIFNLVINSSKSQFEQVFLSQVLRTAIAGSECGIQESENGKPDTGSLCTCDGQVIIPQTCDWTTGGDCSPITCD